MIATLKLRDKISLREMDLDDAMPGWGGTQSAADSGAVSIGTRNRGVGKSEHADEGVEQQSQTDFSGQISKLQVSGTSYCQSEPSFGLHS